MIEFLKTIYLGDRACKSMQIDGWNSVVKIQVDCISRVHGEAWDFGTDEDIEDGFLVFEGVRTFSLSPPGVIPNDLINEIKVESGSQSKEYRVTLSIDSVDASGKHTEVLLSIDAQGLHLEDPKRPGLKIA